MIKTKMGGVWAPTRNGMPNGCRHPFEAKIAPLMGQRRCDGEIEVMMNRSERKQRAYAALYYLSQGW